MSKNVYERFSVAGDYLVLRTTEKYHKTASGKSWQKKPYAVDREVFKTKNYEGFIQSIPCFTTVAHIGITPWLDIFRQKLQPYHQTEKSSK